MATLTARWVDRGVEPQSPPDPRYPDGIDLDLAQPGQPACRVDLDHPTPRCGYWVLHCRRCGLSAMVTTAGRPDDPRSVTVPCGPLSRADVHGE